MSDVISATPVKAGTYKVYYQNGVYMGDFVCHEDGYFYFWPEQKDGAMPAYVLRALADKLDELNKEWDDQIQNDPRIGA